ncbi:MAG: peptidoglycan-associated lipoprotein Pal [Gammaproteobacteria bacterium]|nr:peptidoglycan-associated lipoprotein Pal [Gammaproteobacteria bacterium]
MNIKSLLKLGTITAGALLVASCSGTNQLLDGTGLNLDGLGHLTHFAGQAPGEMYTTEAPHNQVYLFSYDSSAVASQYVASIKAQAKYLNTHPSARIMLAGNTDERGSREYNVALGERRAKSVAHMMRMSGVSKNQIRVVSYGKEKPANLGHSDEARAQNRRVELIFEAK